MQLRGCVFLTVSPSLSHYKWEGGHARLWNRWKFAENWTIPKQQTNYKWIGKILISQTSKFLFHVFSIMVIVLVWASANMAAFIWVFSVERTFSNTSHHLEIKVIRQSHCCMFHAFSSSHYRLLNWHCCFVDYATLFWHSVCVSNLISCKLYENSKKINSFLLCTWLLKLLLKKQQVNV